MLDNKTFLEVIDKTPLVSVDLIVEHENGDILLGKRQNKPAQNFWFVPGGRIVKNETIEQAFQRLCLKELGLNMSIQQASLLGCFDHIYDDNFLAEPNINTHYVTLGYKLVIPASMSIIKDEQHASFEWWSINNLMQSNEVHSNTKAYFSSLTP